MFVRRTTRTYKGKSYANYVLVESVRTPAGPRQRTICSLGDLAPAPRDRWLGLARKLEHALAGQADLIEPPEPALEAIAEELRERRGARRSLAAQRQATPASAPPHNRFDAVTIVVDPHAITTERHREAGTVHVGCQFWKRLGLDAILRDLGLSATLRQRACATT